MAELNYSCDVAIIGAGPAGSVLGYLLAGDGVRVVLIDKARFPRPKVCAGGLPDKVLRVLPFDISSVIEREVFDVTVTHRLGGGFTKTYSSPLIYTVSRDKFDNLLAGQARNAGALLLDDQKPTSIGFENGSWTVRTAGASVRAPLLAGADGAYSIVARTLKIRPGEEFHTGLQIEVPFDSVRETGVPGKGIVFDLGTMKDGYGWIFPKRETLSMGVKGPMCTGRRLMLYLERLLDHFGVPFYPGKVSGHLIPHRLRASPIATDRALLVGDAAGLADFWTGEGIFHAIRSADLAARHITAFLEGRANSLRGYESAVDSKMMPEFLVSHQFSRAFNYVHPIIFAMLEKLDYPWDVFCRIMRGDRTLAEVRKRLRPDTFIAKLLFKNLRAHDTHKWTQPRRKPTGIMADI